MCVGGGGGEVRARVCCVWCGRVRVCYEVCVWGGGGGGGRVRVSGCGCECVGVCSHTVGG